MNVSCQCGAIRFKTSTETPRTLFHCHCLECRKQSASAFGTSAIFPFFSVPDAVAESSNSDSTIVRNVSNETKALPANLGLWSRSTDSGATMDCYFCKICGTRLAHVKSDRRSVSVKAGSIEGLNWEGAMHIYCRSAVVPIPEGVKRWEADPEF